METEFGNPVFVVPSQEPGGQGSVPEGPVLQATPIGTAAVPPAAPATGQSPAPALTARQVSARAIKPGCSEDAQELKQWKGDADAKPHMDTS